MRKKTKRKPWKWIMVLLGLFVLLIIGGCTALMSMGNVIMDKEKVMEQSETSIIYDKDDNEVSKLYVEENRQYVEYQNIPSIVVQAFVNTEDERFFTHNGVDIISIGRALYKDILAGSAVEGASTITQQLARNVYLTTEKSLWRKTKEALIALNLERNYSKEQILEFYLNEILFGDAVYGIQAASEYYFGKKDLNDLTLAEVATLAGLPKGPNSYSPFKNYEKSVQRRKVVLSLMYKNGSITKEQMEAASKEELKLAPKGKKGKEGYQAYIDYVIKEAQEEFNLTENELYRGGYKIYTNLDVQAQNAMVKAFNDPDLFPTSQSQDKVQAGMVILDPHSGGVVAMMGGRDYGSGDFNRAIQAKRSPGSTFKPIAVYTPALEQGWNPYDSLKDEKMTFAGGYSPSNWNGDGYWGRVTMFEAIKRSKNVPAVWLLNEIGIDTSFRYLDRFGIPYDKQADRKLGIALGDLTHGLSPFDMASAYSAFANHGVIIEPHAIIRLEDREGEIIEPEISSSTVMTEQTAWYMTEMLKGVVEGSGGTGKNARMNRPVAGKTGTTQMEGTRGGNRDAWFVGYTPEYVGSIWMGYDIPNSKTNYLKQGSAVTAKLFRVVMTDALKGRKITEFEKPGNIEDLEPPKPKIVPINDLRAEQTADSIQLTWTANQEEGTIYRVYRYFDDPAQKELLGETEYNEWVDLSVAFDKPVHYLVVPYNPELEIEGGASNIVEVITVPVNPELLPPEEENGDELEDPNQDDESEENQEGDQEEGQPGDSTGVQQEQNEQQDQGVQSNPSNGNGRGNGNGNKNKNSNDNGDSQQEPDLLEPPTADLQGNG